MSESIPQLSCIAHYLLIHKFALFNVVRSSVGTFGRVCQRDEKVSGPLNLSNFSRMPFLKPSTDSTRVSAEIEPG